MAVGGSMDSSVASSGLGGTGSGWGRTFGFLAAVRVRDGLGAEALAGAGWEGSRSEAAGDADGTASWPAATGGAG